MTKPPTFAQLQRAARKYERAATSTNPAAANVDPNEAAHEAARLLVAFVAEAGEPFEFYDEDRPLGQMGVRVSDRPKPTPKPKRTKR